MAEVGAENDVEVGAEVGGEIDAEEVAGAKPFILVLAGVNGAGKSSVGGALLAGHGLTWFNPDSFARELVAQLGLSVTQANGRAWEFGRAQLEAAITNGANYV